MQWPATAQAAYAGAQCVGRALPPLIVLRPYKQRGNLLTLCTLQAAADVKVLDQHGALRFIKSSKGCLLRDLTAAYPAAPEDLAKMKSEGLIWILPSAEKEQEAVFAADQPPPINVSEDLMKLWHQVEV